MAMPWPRRSVQVLVIRIILCICCIVVFVRVIRSSFATVAFGNSTWRFSSERNVVQHRKLSNSQPNNNSDISIPWLEPREMNLVFHYVQDVESYLEFGSGGSTLTFPKRVRLAASIEHDPTWCKKMQLRLEQDSALSHVDYRCVSTTNPRPGDDGAYVLFKQYVNEVRLLGLKRWDVVFIDGRARVACAIRVLPFLHAKSVVLFHDFARPIYHVVLEYYSVLRSIESGYEDQRGIVALRRKTSYDWIEGRDDDVLEILNLSSDAGMI